VRRLLTTFALAAALLVGCGDDEEDGGRTATVSEGATVRVVADEYSFDPETVVYESTGPRTEVTISLDNQGSLAHNLKLFDGDRDLGGTPTFQGGREEAGSVELEPGEYRMVCTVGNHEELGMTGTLELR
jgi:plastocyanin